MRRKRPQHPTDALNLLAYNRLQTVGKHPLIISAAGAQLLADREPQPLRWVENQVNDDKHLATRVPDCKEFVLDWAAAKMAEEADVFVDENYLKRVPPM
jgi:hypothetical protein